MSGRRATPAEKQRVRTGCLTCRRRRRKCDERKPQCENCEAKGFACKYPSGLAFVPSTASALQQSPPPSGGTAPAYGKITFVVENEDSVPPSTEIENRVSIDVEDEIAVVDPDVAEQALIGSTGLHSDPANISSPLAHSGLGSVVTPRLVQDADEQMSHNARSSIADYQPDSPRRYRQNAAQNGFYRRSTFSNQSVQRHALTPNNQETDLLRHFRYNVTPWIDVGDPESPFGIKVMLLAKSNRPLFAAILALSALQRSLVSREKHDFDLQNSIVFRAEAEQGLFSLENNLLASVAKVLLLLGDFICSSTLQWRSFVSQRTHILGNQELFATRDEELNESLSWVFVRIDLAASVAHAQQPIIPVFSYPSSPSFATSFLQSQGQAAKQFYHQSLVLLATCLILIHDDHQENDVAAHDFMPASNLSSRWTAYWSDCQKWYNDRPVQLQQIIEIRGTEADEVNRQNPSAFPILVYTTPLALVSNVIYHITSILLLTYKPRLLKNLPGPRCFTSLIWHAHSIVGIVTSNEFPEQWDPVVIAGLLLVAKDMTHESQQLVLLERFDKVSTTTGINLSHEIEAIQAEWNISRYGEEAVT